MKYRRLRGYCDWKEAKGRERPGASGNAMRRNEMGELTGGLTSLTVCSDIS